MKLTYAILVLLVTVIAIVLTARKTVVQKPTRGYYEMSQAEKLDVWMAYHRELGRLSDQVQWRLEQAQLYRRWDAVKVYQEKLNTLNAMNEVMRDMRADPTVYRDDLQKIDNWLKTGQ